MDRPPVSLVEYTRQLEDICEFKDISRLTSFAISIFREHQRNGYAADAIDLILRYGFYEQRLHRCNSECLSVNKASILLHEKLGFQEEGRR